MESEGKKKEAVPVLELPGCKAHGHGGKCPIAWCRKNRGNWCRDSKGQWCQWRNA